MKKPHLTPDALWDALPEPIRKVHCISDTDGLFPQCPDTGDRSATEYVYLWQKDQETLLVFEYGAFDRPVPDTGSLIKLYGVPVRVERVEEESIMDGKDRISWRHIEIGLP